MALNLSVALRNARLDAIETLTSGSAPILKIFSGAKPTACADADPSGVLVSMTLPTNWMNNAGSGQKTMLGTWEDTSADGTGTAQSFRLYMPDGSTCFLQGTVGQGTGDLSLDNASIVAGQKVTITGFTLTDGNA